MIKLTGKKQMDSGMLMNIELLNKLQAELGKTGHHVCGEDLGSILVSDEVEVDYDNMRILRNGKYIADIVKMEA